LAVNNLPHRPPKVDLTGKTFGSWSVLLYAGRTPDNGDSLWVCQCSCMSADRKVVRGAHLRKGRSTSCGCYDRERRIKHGKSRTQVHRAWSSMKQRCLNARSKSWFRYGGRGIAVAQEWLGPHGFENFYAYVGDPPSSAYSLDRIDNDGDYEPGNVRWATKKEQGSNRASSRLLTYRGLTMTVSEWAREMGIHPVTLGLRLFKGWPVRRALETPLRVTSKVRR
jgi:hypothetical protein